ncbi:MULTISPECIES: GIY-YIG nuclease family protein [unclassified Adlercreutzia]|uniref:GIY-YIG nuclease family protein n=1 Tax=unclassified Adlercreutzia TaxID=2636013 RepID=UPI0013EB9D68|nr:MULTISPECIES: GIY-YIG nuclease family protein [unclassified Adlercreutzia]
MAEGYYVYVMSNVQRTVLYVGVTSDLARRVAQHKQHLAPGFTDRYNATDLIYFEQTCDVEEAIRREKQLKGWTRAKKLKLIQKTNPHLEDLSTT